MDVATYKAKTAEFICAVEEAEFAVTESAREVLGIANAEIDTGPHPWRSTEVAYTANRNFLSVAAKVVVGFVALGAWETVKEGAKGAVQGGIKYGAYTVAPVLLEFFAANAPMLREMAAMSGFAISWLPAFLTWLELQRKKGKLPPQE